MHARTLLERQLLSNSFSKPAPRGFTSRVVLPSRTLRRCADKGVSTEQVSQRDELFPLQDCASDDEVCIAEKDQLIQSINEMTVDGSYDEMQLYDTRSCAHGNIMGIMRKEQVLTALPSSTLEEIIPSLNKVTGLPVLGADGRVIGVISRKDIIRVKKDLGSMQDTVAQHMRSPAITVSMNTSVQDAADLMLKSKIRRFPVVDDEGFPVGIVSRSDIYRPLFVEAYNIFMEKEKAALTYSSSMDSSGEEVFSAQAPTPLMSNKAKMAPAIRRLKKTVTWKIKYLYDGDCAMCLSLKRVLRRQDNGRDLIKFVNIADPDYKPKSHMGIAYEEAMETIHAIQQDGTVLYGTEALRQLFDTVGLGWATKLMELPLVSKLVDLLYNFLSANRLSLGGALDGIIAAKRMDLSKQGKQTCSDIDEECLVEW